jgi:hypothetical protein
MSYTFAGWALNRRMGSRGRSHSRDRHLQQRVEPWDR